MASESDTPSAPKNSTNAASRTPRPPRAKGMFWAIAVGGKNAITASMSISGSWSALAAASTETHCSSWNPMPAASTESTRAGR